MLSLVMILSSIVPDPCQSGRELLFQTCLDEAQRLVCDGLYDYWDCPTLASQHCQEAIRTVCQL